MALRSASQKIFSNIKNGQIYIAAQRMFSSSQDPITHTGQQWADNDYRLSRFVDKEKKVNQNWAEKLIREVPPTETKSRVVSCDGGGGLTGHPKIYINLDKPGDHSCNYCGLRFEKKSVHH